MGYLQPDKHAQQDNKADNQCALAPDSVVHRAHGKPAQHTHTANGRKYTHRNCRGQAKISGVGHDMHNNGQQTKENQYFV